MLALASPCLRFKTSRGLAYIPSLPSEITWPTGTLEKMRLNKACRAIFLGSRSSADDGRHSACASVGGRKSTERSVSFPEGRTIEIERPDLRPKSPAAQLRPETESVADSPPVFAAQGFRGFEAAGRWGFLGVRRRGSGGARVERAALFLG